MAPRQTRTRGSRHPYRKILRQPWFGLLKKSGYETHTRSAEDAITQLVAFSTFCILVPLFTILLVFGVSSVLTTLGIDIKDNFAFTTILPIGVAFIGFLISFDLIKEIINKEIMALERELTPEHDELEKLRKRNRELENSSDCNLREEQQKYYLARTYIADSEAIDWISFERQSHPIHQTQYRNTEEARTFLEGIYFSREARRKLRLVITKIQRESWIRLASDASIVALEQEGANEEKLNHDPAMNRFFVDIYLYLDGWLVSSIDNDVAAVMPFMPITDIGLHYPSIENPNLEAYDRAFSFLIEVFETGLFYKLIASIQHLKKEEVEICSEVVPYLNELIIKINDFVNSKGT